MNTQILYLLKLYSKRTLPLSSVIALLCFLGFSLQSGAAPSNSNKRQAKAAIVDSSKGSVSYSNGWSTLQLKPFSNKPENQKPKLENPWQSLTIDRSFNSSIANSAWLGFIYKQGSQKKLTNAYHARAFKSPATFYFQCGTVGSFTIGWEQGMSSSGCQTVTVGSQIASNTKGLFEVKATRSSMSEKTVQFCSAVADSGSGWGAVVTQLRWDILSVEDPCNQAVRRCEANSGGSSCSVTNMGKKNITEPQEKFTIVLKCGKDILLDRTGRPYGETNTPENLDRWLVDTANSDFLKLNSCTTNVLTADEFLVLPTTDTTTVISAGDDIQPFKEPVIVVLAGRVKIISPNLSFFPSSIAAGQVCYLTGTPFVYNTQSGEYTISPVCTRSIVAEQGRRNGYDRNGDLYPRTRESVYRFVKNFFQINDLENHEGWSPDFAESVEKYQKAVEKDFCDGNCPTR